MKCQFWKCWLKTDLEMWGINWEHVVLTGFHREFAASHCPPLADRSLMVLLTTSDRVIEGQLYWLITKKVVATAWQVHFMWDSEQIALAHTYAVLYDQSLSYRICLHIHECSRILWLRIFKKRQQEINIWCWRTRILAEINWFILTCTTCRSYVRILAIQDLSVRAARF